MPPSSGELWGHHLMPQQISVDCLLPSGILVTLTCSRDAALKKVKRELWQDAKKYPLYALLSEPSSYIFIGITQDAEREEFYDEERRLCDLRLFQPILKIVEPEGNREEKMLNYEIGLAIGMPLAELDEMKEHELIEFRRNMVAVCEEAIKLREESGDALYVYPPHVESSPELPANILYKLDEGQLVIAIWVLAQVGGNQKYSVKVAYNALPEAIIEAAIRKKARSMQISSEEQQRCVKEYKNNYLLKVCGCNQYMLGAHPACQYQYMRNCIAKDQVPQLMLMNKKAVFDQIAKNQFTMPSFMRRGIAFPQPKQTLSLWEIDSQLRIKIVRATYVNIKELDRIYVKAGIYHGTEPLCPVLDTAQVIFSNPKWNEWLDFDIYAMDLPRCARLSLSLCSLAKRKKGKEEYCAIAWGNIMLFDYKSQSRSDKFSIYLWPMPKNIDDLQNPLGICGSNPNKDSPCLELEFDRYIHPVVFPNDAQIEQYANFLNGIDPNSAHARGSTVAPASKLTTEVCDEDLEQLREIVKRDPLSETSEQEKELLWRLRHECKEMPDSLPRLLDVVRWNCRDDVSHLYTLLKDWPTVSPETALELLDCTYPDLRVREFAVSCLGENLSDDQLSQYLLQLVQVMKYELYVNNALSKFLLKKALINTRIGHFFFWHIKAEMQHFSSTHLRFGLLLEAYCRGCGAYLKELNKQVEALEKLTKLSHSLKERKEDSQKAIKYMLEQVGQADYLEALKDFSSPIDNSFTLGELIIEECKILGSAKRPLWLVWKNKDSMADKLHPTNSIIFKSGDDLRQDMLTLQVIRIMDDIWKNEGYDLRMMPYCCLATGKEVGMIQVVQNAETVFHIQKGGGKKAAFQVDSSQLHRWIKEKSRLKAVGQHAEEKAYESAIETFTLSCAGYCVATFVLGIGDRHPDNIMVNEEGQIFHIDFGHFLHHIKKKYGIKRERVPFVLTEDFMRVIAKDADYPTKTKEFEKFNELCGKAYLCLRRHANLFITLFTMMLNAGIPELQSFDDVEYLRKTLAVEKKEQQAIEYFQAQFHEAYGGAWTTKLDWFFHGVKHM